jgi:hypothetical protein
MNIFLLNSKHTLWIVGMGLAFLLESCATESVKPPEQGAKVTSYKAAECNGNGNPNLGVGCIQLDEFRD